MTTGLKRLLGFGSIKLKLMIYSLILIIIMLTTSFYTLYNTKHILGEFDYMLKNDVYLTDLSKDIKNTDNELLGYLTTKSSDSLGGYIKDSDKLRKGASNMNRSISYDKDQLILKDIANMIDEYLNQGDAAISAKRGRDVNELNIRYKNANNISAYINDYIKTLNLGQFHENTKKYFEISEKLKYLQILNITIIVAAFLLNVVLTFWFADTTSIPIVNLAKSADEISKGNFEVEDVNVDSNDELKVMAIAFNKMKDNIKNHIYELEYKAEMESKLNDEKVDNLKIKNLLKNAQLQSLQSQINPHFLFNTLNAGVQLAMMENAEKTGYFLEKMSELFRYNLSKMDKPVTLQEEIQNVYAYIFLLETRFGDFIKFHYDIDNGALDVNMPALIIQPLIENACIHGIGDMENGGEINIIVKTVNDYIEVKIVDNGKGMEQKTIDAICNLTLRKADSKSFDIKGHTTGIGLDNVIKRLKAFYGKDDVIQIKSILGSGTSIILRLPHVKGDGNDV
jgi:two-component system, sensor histidine kinase YesM